MTATKTICLVVLDLVASLNSPSTPSPVFNSQQKLAAAIITLQSILGRDKTNVQSTVPTIKLTKKPRLCQVSLLTPTPTIDHHNQNKTIYILLIPSSEKFISILQQHHYGIKGKSHPLMSSRIFITSSTTRATEKILHTMKSANIE